VTHSLLANFIFHDENEGFATDYEGNSKNCRKLRQLSQEEEIKRMKIFANGLCSLYLCNVKQKNDESKQFLQ
jgi:hypothetical protein